MTVDNTININEKKWRKYAQLFLLALLLLLSMRNSQQAAAVSKQQFVVSVAQAQDAAPKSQWQAYVDTFDHDEDDEESAGGSSDAPSRGNDRNAVVGSTDDRNDTTMTLVESTTEKVTKPLVNASPSSNDKGNASDVEPRNALAVEPNTNTTSVRSLVLPREPREYYEKLPPCEIKVTNQRNAHFEVIESTAKLIPYEYLNLTRQNCNHYHLHFEFETVQQGWLARANTWVQDMTERVTNTSMMDHATGIQRSFGVAVIRRLQTRKSWNQVIQVSCSCSEKDRKWLMLSGTKDYAPRVCIGHGYCAWSMNYSNYIQVSPHYQRYFVPSALPHFNHSPFEPDHRLDICTIGSIKRRKWNLLIPFLEDDNLKRQYLDKIRIRILGKGGMPKPLRNYTNYTQIQQHQFGDDRRFYAAVKACDIIMLPIGKDNLNKGYQHYFKSVNGSHWKLSGTIPPIIAFERPYLIPNEILELYQKELPLHIPHRGFENENFAEQLASLIEALLPTKQKLMESFDS